MIRFEQVSKKFKNDTYVIKSLNLEIKNGEFFVLIGPSGCGKTTTLKMINRLINLSEGTLWINDKKITDYDINELRWNIGYVLQQIALFPHMTIAENIAIVPELRKWSRQKIQQRVDELLEMVGLDPEQYRNRKPNELSGGQQQRIGVIRALAADPDIILMDEPFSALDPISREKLQDDLVNLQRSIKKTIVFVTHDMQEALKLGDRICVMREGKIEQTGTPQEIINNPINEFVRDFVGVKTNEMDEKINLENIVYPISSETHPIKSLNIISASVSLKEVLTALTHDEEVRVEKDGNIIGSVNRKVIIEYLASN
ncbi:glycine/betaine ABC transporter ATP-binding protein [Priestia megaterium]|uniref:Quaternary amine transport ATP-binding protein n=1 Tax=Priestia megaterium TaxID=1404 RepID=A0A3D8WWJ6_PRIMG|nr:ABC transporter ATP-binding protein [Priestia megaterium]MDH3169463.1 ABC transporter ATP-binding protein [Priestia megaterium]RDZ10112.1 glycine/betaine ABC transporter ATP-binding protein [Priestia megaterium]